MMQRCSCRITLLGQLEVNCHGETFSRFSTRKSAALLGYLALHQNKTHSREELVELFWSKKEVEAGRQSLRQALSSLRHQLEPPGTSSGTVLLSDRNEIRLNPQTVVTDVAEFESAISQSARNLAPEQKRAVLEHSVRLYTGSLLPGYYDEWVLSARERLHQTWLESLFALITLLSEADDHFPALSYALRLLEEAPEEERSHYAAIREYTALGRREEALRQYEQWEALCLAEYACPPSPEMLVLKAQIAASPATRQIVIAALPESRQAPPSATEIALSPSQSLFSSLPVPFTRIFGRQQEITALIERLSENVADSDTPFLITLTGIGGTGKTRLALEVARRIADQGKIAVYFVPLAEVGDAVQIPDAVRKALCLSASPSADPLEQAASLLNRTDSLLLLDNFEHLAETGTEALRRLQQFCPKLRILLTSRLLLHLEGEREFPVMPLATPLALRLATAHDVSFTAVASRQDFAATPEELLLLPCVQLFVDRMRARRPDFQITAANAGAVAMLCDSLEGLPLALELAAGWARTLTPAQMLSRLNQRFELLVSHRRDVPLRHQSLHAVLEWSFQRLDFAAQDFLCSLSVFRGGCTVTAAEAVCSMETTPNASFSTLDALAKLQEYSLVFAEEQGAEMRYSLLETVREFTLQQMSEAARHTLAARYAEYFTAWAQEASAEMRGLHAIERTEQLERENNNLRAALDWSLIHTPDTALRLSTSLYWFWYVRGYRLEGRCYLETALEAAQESPSALRAYAYIGAGHLANCLGDNDVALAHYDQAFALYKQTGDLHGIALATCRIGNVRQEQGHLEEAHQLCQESLEMFRRLNDASGQILALFYLSNVLEELKNLDECLHCQLEGLKLARSQQDTRYISLFLLCLGGTAYDRGDFGQWASYHRESLEIQKRLREPDSVLYSLRDLAIEAMLQGDLPRAACLCAAMENLAESIRFHHVNPAILIPLYSALQTLPEQEHSRWWQKGRAMSLSQAIEYALLETRTQDI